MEPGLGMSTTAAHRRGHRRSKPRYYRRRHIEDASHLSASDILGTASGELPHTERNANAGADWRIHSPGVFPPKRSVRFVLVNRWLLILLILLAGVAGALIALDIVR